MPSSDAIVRNYPSQVLSDPAEASLVPSFSVDPGIGRREALIHFRGVCAVNETPWRFGQEIPSFKRWEEREEKNQPESHRRRLKD